MRTKVLTAVKISIFVFWATLCGLVYVVTKVLEGHTVSTLSPEDERQLCSSETGNYCNSLF
jgi:hypothetical protein